MAIAFGLVALAGASLDASHLAAVESARISMVDRLAAVNLFLAAFKMIPAFPMYGGRGMRAGDVAVRIAWKLLWSWRRESRRYRTSGNL